MLATNSILVLLALLASSPPILTQSQDSLPPSSPRKSINYGPELSTHSIKTSVYSNHNNDPNSELLQASLIRFNTASASSFSPIKHTYHHAHPSSLKQLGVKIATEFLHHLHPSTSLDFQLTSAHISKHTNVLHAYFVQTIPLGDLDHHLKVHNAVANLNVDLDPRSPKFGHILSHSDSFHPILDHPSPTHAINFLSTFGNQDDSRCTQLKNQFDRVLRSLSSSHQLLNQQVMGLFSTQSSQDSTGDEKKLLTDFSEEELRLIAECEVSNGVKEPIRSEIVDPRVALVSFLTLAADPETENHLRSRSLEDLIESIDIIKKTPSSSFLATSDSGEGPSRDPPTFELFNVPGALGPDSLDGVSSTKATSAELAWLSVDEQSDHSQSGKRELKMVWRFEYRSNSNWYESYVDASSPGLVPMVVDWVNDFRPTSELASSYSEHVAIQAALIEEFKSLPKSSASLGRDPSQSKSESDLPVLPKGATDERRTASYRVFPWSVNDPTLGKREIVEGPSNPIASPLGWHTIPPTHRASEQRDISHLSAGWSRHLPHHGLRATDSRGNNVYAQENWEGLDNWESNYRPNGTDDLQFHFHLGWNRTHSPTETHINPKQYIDAAVSELFFTCNEYHDLTYLYGFDEESGNFQQHNFDRGGRGNDAVIANAQDGSGYNNANFATPPDGRNGRMRMYIWNGAEPWRDGDLEAGIVIHEYSHGVSIRLTGGPANSGCLGWGESGGMGEGWGDFFATLIRMHKSKPVDFTMGEWASGVKGGIRKYKYSLDNKINPETYQTLDKPGYWGVHAIGEVWAEMLFTVAEELIAKHGFEQSLFPPTDETDKSDFYKVSKLSGKKVPKHGNTLIFQLVLDGMKIQPCRPGFFDARNAILEADSILTGGENQCEIWKGFSKRGLGPKAAIKGNTPWGGGIRTDDFSLPQGVCDA
ncbi:Fungalysin/Thermolysin Extracellular metalloproteinase 5 [Puccinia graminis f. sp. tritici]|uniref:Extracellular metalloproteinase n=1 Tax=Puccinia graminis f. sp. tritici TaxID=56615 RepID=A0A5B0N717_PUCGR|nr:Fungalysin/Thermolysin Extracellular metalloproteinase 5 [Puccinia graminis f. sp. tritici]